MTSLESAKANSPEHKELNTQKLTVMQPDKLGDLLNTITLMDSISERVGETKSGDLGSGGTSSAQGDDDDTTPTSARDRAIANLPAAPVMQKQLIAHIQQDIKQLRKTIKSNALKAGKAGSAYRFNELYSKIRRLSSFMSAMLNASADVVKRIYIRVFVDKQEIL